MSACNDCPFYKHNPLNGSPEWLLDVMERREHNEFFRHTCHKTDPNADGYRGAKKVKDCTGHIQMMMNYCDQTPGRGGVWGSLTEMAQAYLAYWKKLREHAG